MACSNNVLAILNTLTLLLSIPILVTGIYLSNNAPSPCEHTIHTPIIALGLFLMIMSIVCIIGACCRVNWLLWFYLAVMFILIFALLGFTVFSFVVTNKGAGNVLSNKGYKEYRLGDYSNWLRNRVDNVDNWRKIKSCLVDSNVCSRLMEDHHNTLATQFFGKILSPIESGCCKPPDNCNFQYVNATTWTKNATANSANPDCNAWSNDRSSLCYNCDSCKAGLLHNIKGQWKKVAVVNILVLVCIIIVYSFGCCAFRSNRSANAWKRQRHP